VVAPIKELNWAITGGGGQLARSITNLLDRQGAKYRSWDKHDLDVSNPENLNKISDFAPSVIVNCAAWTNVEGAESCFEQAVLTNRDGAMNMALVAKRMNIPLIHISTDYVFSGDRQTPWKVEDETRPSSKYGESKLLGEFEIKKIWPDKSVILRTAWLYGPFCKNFAKTIIKKAISTEETVNVVDDQRGQPTSTFDLAQRIFKIANLNLVSGIYHASNSGEATWWDFACELFYLSGKSINRVNPIPSCEYPSSIKRPNFTVLDHSNWDSVGLDSMRDWREALHEIFPTILKEVESELQNG
jgi:dTDP-4-dehydrorhamnose reductase